MGLLARLFGPKEDEHAEVRPLWHAVVARARDPRWYAQLGVADSLPGRFDAITIVLGWFCCGWSRKKACATAPPA